MGARVRLAASLALAGGVAAAAGSFLPWVEFSAGPISERATGISGWEGKATLLASIVVIGAAARVFTGTAEASGMRAPALMAGLAACGVCLYTAVTARDQLLDAAEVDLPRSVVQNALDTGLLQLTWAVGFFVVIVGGALAIVATLVLPSGTRPHGPACAGRGLDEWAAISPPPGSGSTSASDPWSDEPAPSEPPAPGLWVTPPRPDVDPDAPP